MSFDEYLQSVSNLNSAHEGRFKSIEETLTEISNKFKGATDYVNYSSVNITNEMVQDAQKLKAPLIEDMKRVVNDSLDIGYYITDTFDNFIGFDSLDALLEDLELIEDGLAKNFDTYYHIEKELLALNDNVTLMRYKQIVNAILNKVHDTNSILIKGYSENTLTMGLVQLRVEQMRIFIADKVEQIDKLANSKKIAKDFSETIKKSIEKNAHLFHKNFDDIASEVESIYKKAKTIDKVNIKQVHKNRGLLKQSVLDFFRNDLDNFAVNLPKGFEFNKKKAAGFINDLAELYKVHPNVTPDDIIRTMQLNKIAQGREMELYQKLLNDDVIDKMIKGKPVEVKSHLVAKIIGFDKDTASNITKNVPVSDTLHIDDIKEFKSSRTPFARLVEDWYDINGAKINTSVYSLAQRVEEFMNTPVQDSEGYIEAMDDLINLLTVIRRQTKGELTDSSAFSNKIMDLLGLLETFEVDYAKEEMVYVKLADDAVKYKLKN